MIILNKYKSVNEYLENILKFKYCLHLLKIRCKVCNSVLQYHGCYEVNHISTDGEIKIPILRGVCKGCKGNPTHSIKPCFLPGKHQYDLSCREKAIMSYEKGKRGLHKAMRSAFGNLQVAISNLQYWLKTSSQKADKITKVILAKIQESGNNIDILSKYFMELQSKHYIDHLFNLCRWYVEHFTGNQVKDSPFSLINSVSNEEVPNYL